MTYLTVGDTCAFSDVDTTSREAAMDEANDIAERLDAVGRCLDALCSMVSVAGVAVASRGHMSDQEARSFDSAYGRYNAARQDMAGKGDGR